LDTTKLACATSSSPECFTPEQLTALTQIFAGRRDRYGRTVAAGYRPSGAEAGFPITGIGWEGWITAGQPDGGPPPALAVFARGLLEDLSARTDLDLGDVRLRRGLHQSEPRPSN
jgi:hypothetical protein